MCIIYRDIQLIKPTSQVIFIRFNPDKYMGIQHKTKERYKYLYDLIIYLINQPVIELSLGQLKLFYDNFTGTPIIEPLDEFIFIKFFKLMT